MGMALACEGSFRSSNKQEPSPFNTRQSNRQNTKPCRPE